MAIKWRPHAYQIKAVNWQLGNNCAALFLAPGLGKSSITLRSLIEAKKAGIKKTLVIGPLRVIYSSWPEELAKWEDFSGLRAEIWHGKEPCGICDSTADIILVNYEYIQKMVDRIPGGKEDLFCQYYGLDGLVIDELTAYKSTNSGRFRLMKKLSPQFKFRWGLTGSPVANRLEDIFGQAMVLDGGRTFGPWVSRFRNTYFNTQMMGSGARQFPRYSPKPEKRDELFRKIGEIGLRMSAEDYLNMPQLIDDVRTVELPASIQPVYKCLERDFIAILRDKTIIGVTKAAAMNKCRQMASGVIYTTKDHDYDVAHESKLDAIKLLVEELQGEPLLVFVAFRSEAEVLAKVFPGCGVIIGGTSAAEGQTIKEAWDRRELPILIANPESIGHGINLQAGGNHMCWMTLPWNYEVYEQSIDRLYRQGQTKPVVNHILQAKGTIDSYVRKVLKSKGMTQDAMFDFLTREMEDAERDS